MKEREKDGGTETKIKTWINVSWHIIKNYQFGDKFHFKNRLYDAICFTKAFECR